MSLQMESTLKMSDGVAVAVDILSSFGLSLLDSNVSQKRNLMQYVPDARHSIEPYGEDGFGARPNTMGGWE